MSGRVMNSERCSDSMSLGSSRKGDDLVLVLTSGKLPGQRQRW